MLQHDDGANNIRGLLRCAICSWQHVVTTDCAAENVMESHLMLDHAGMLNNAGLQGTPYGDNAFEYFVHLNH